MATPRAADSIHLHVDNCSPLGPVFQATEERVRGAIARRPGLEARIRVTIDSDGEGFDAAMATADALFCWEVHERDKLAARAPNLRWIHIHGAGLTHLRPFDWLPRRTALTNSRGVHGQRAAEYVFMAILMLHNRLPEMLTNQRGRRWEQLYNTEICGKTLLIIGVGHVGASVAPWAKRLGMRVVGIRRSGRPRRYVDEMHTPDALPGLLPEADVVLVTAPHTRHTHHLVGRAELDLMRPGAGIINYSRAHLIDYDALREKLVRGELSAILDVFDPEPLPPESPMWDTPNLVISPHSSSDDEEFYTPRTLDLVCENAVRFLAGKPLKNRVSRKYEY